MKVQKSAIYQYVLLYCLLLLNQSVAYKVYGMMLCYVSLGLAVLIGLSRCPYVFCKTQVIVPLCGLILSILVIRLTGGVEGLQFVIQVATDIIVAAVAYEADRDNLKERYVNLVYVMAIISLFCFAISQFFPDLMRKVLGLSYSQLKVFSQGQGWANSTNWDYYGHWFYSFGRELHRNCGIYTEPGLYVIVLITAIILLLYCGNSMFLSERKIMNRIVFLIITVITAGSATGFIMLILVVAVLLYFRNKQNDDTIKNRIVKRLSLLTAIIILIAFADFVIRGTDSIISKYLIEKLLTLNFKGAMETTGSTGNARLANILQGFVALIRYPWGAGLNRMAIISQEFNTANFSAGCGLFYYLGVLGIIGWTSIVTAFAIPCRKIQDKSLKIVFVLMYIIYGLSQGNFWTGIILVCVLTCTESGGLTQGD